MIATEGTYEQDNDVVFLLISMIVIIHDLPLTCLLLLSDFKHYVEIPLIQLFKSKMSVTSSHGPKLRIDV